MNMLSSAPKYREKERNEQAQDDGRTSAADEQEIWTSEEKTETENLGMDIVYADSGRQIKQLQASII